MKKFQLFPHRRIQQAMAGSKMIECHGVRFPDDPKIISPRIRQSLVSGGYEKNEATRLSKLLIPGDRVLELGAGLGLISTLASLNERVEEVLCYEADPRLIEYIRTVHKLNGARKATVRHAVLSNDTARSEVPFYVRRTFWGSSLTAGGHMSVVNVPVQSFNDTIKSFRPSFIVCDIEGGELDLFMNAELQGVSRVLMEIHTRALGRTGIKTLFDTMSRLGFHYDQDHSHGSVVLFSHISRPMNDA